MQDPTWPSANLVNVTKSDATVHQPALRQLYVGTGGDVVIEDASGSHTFKNVADGQVLGPFFATKVLAATTAADIIGFQ